VLLKDRRKAIDNFLLPISKLHGRRISKIRSGCTRENRPNANFL
jgi:hypothetical protein